MAENGRKQSQTELRIQEKDKIDIDFPTEENATKFVEEETIRKREDNGQTYKKYPLSVPIEELGKFGVGLMLYFHFLKYMAIAFSVMFLISIPAIICNGTGDYLTGTKEVTKFDRLTLANQPSKITTSTVGDQAISEARDFQSQMEGRLLWVSIPDLVYSVVFLLFLVFLKRSSSKLIRNHQKESVKVNDFAVRVKGLPPTVIEEENLIDHFKQFGEVEEVYISRNYFGTLFNNQKSANIQKQIAIEKKRLERDTKRSTNRLKILKAKREAIDKETQQLLKSNKLLGKSHNQYPCIDAYVIFAETDIRNKVLKIYKHYWRWTAKRILLSCCWDIKREMPISYQFQGKYPMKLSVPDAPSNIIWENLDVSFIEVILRKLFVYFIVLLLFLITFIIIIGANSFQIPVSTSDCWEYQVLYQYKTLTDYDYEQIKIDKTFTNCYCISQNVSFLTISSNNKTVWNVCETYIINKVILFLMNIATGFVIVIVNFLLKIVLRKLTIFERYKTMTRQTLSGTIKLFVAQFINTALITLILNGIIDGFSLLQAISNIFPDLNYYLKRNAKYHDDFGREWYTQIGSKIISTWIITVVSPHLIFVLMTPLYNCLRRRKQKSAVIQKDLNESKAGPVYDLTPKYALCINVIFVTLFYCGGMPLMLLFGSASLIIQYWCEKYLILRYNRKPIVYDEKLSEMVITIMPIALIFHLCIAIWQYGTDYIFPTEVTISGLTNSISSFNISGDTIGILNRAKKVLWMFLLLLGVVIFYLLELSVWSIIKRIFCVDPTRKVVDLHSQNKKFSEEYDTLIHQGLPSYNIRLNHRYTDLIKAIDSRLNKSNLHDEENVKSDAIDAKQEEASLIDKK